MEDRLNKEINLNEIKLEALDSESENAEHTQEIERTSQSIAPDYKEFLEITPSNGATIKLGSASLRVDQLAGLSQWINSNIINNGEVKGKPTYAG